MTTGIFCATPEELDALHHRFQFDQEPTTIAGFQFWKGQVPDRSRPIVLAQSGTERVNAATLATILFATFGCDDLIFSGVAGALTDLEVGSVVLVTSEQPMTMGSSATASSPVSRSATSRFEALPSPCRTFRVSRTRLSRFWSISGTGWPTNSPSALERCCRATCLSTARMPEPAYKLLAGTSWIWSHQYSKWPAVSKGSLYHPYHLRWGRGRKPPVVR